MSNAIFITVFGKEEITAKAATFGLKAGECIHGSGYGRPGLTGNTYNIKDQIKATGGRWDGECKAWTFESWSVLEAFINKLGE